MTTIYVQFSDSTEEIVIAYFASPQSESEYPNLGTVDSSDKRWAVFYGAALGAECGLPMPTDSSQP